MEDFEHDTLDYLGHLATSNTTFYIQIASLNGVLSFPDRGLNIDFNYRFLADSCISHYQLFLSGTMPEEPSMITSYLESFGVAFSAIVAFNSLIFGKYMPGDDVEDLAWIAVDVLGYARTYREDLDDAVILDGGDYNDELDRVVETLAAEFWRPTPASREAVEALEKVVMIRPDEESHCGVCLEGFVFESEVTKMPCSHAFHGDCIVRWLENSCFCPLYRFALPSDS